MCSVYKLQDFPVQPYSESFDTKTFKTTSPEENENSLRRQKLARTDTKYPENESQRKKQVKLVLSYTDSKGKLTKVRFDKRLTRKVDRKVTYVGSLKVPISCEVSQRNEKPLRNDEEMMSQGAKRYRGRKSSCFSDAKLKSIVEKLKLSPNTPFENMLKDDLKEISKEMGLLIKGDKTEIANRIAETLERLAEKGFLSESYIQSAKKKSRIRNMKLDKDTSSSALSATVGQKRKRWKRKGFYTASISVPPLSAHDKERLQNLDLHSIERKIMHMKHSDLKATAKKMGLGSKNDSKFIMISRIRKRIKQIRTFDEVSGIHFGNVEKLKLNILNKVTVKKDGESLYLFEDQNVDDMDKSKILEVCKKCGITIAANENGEPLPEMKLVNSALKQRMDEIAEVTTLPNSIPHPPSNFRLNVEAKKTSDSHLSAQNVPRRGAYNTRGRRRHFKAGNANINRSSGLRKTRNLNDFPSLIKSCDEETSLVLAASQLAAMAKGEDSKNEYMNEFKAYERRKRNRVDERRRGEDRRKRPKRFEPGLQRMANLLSMLIYFRGKNEEEMNLYSQLTGKKLGVGVVDS